MIVVSDTTPLISLLKISRLDLLEMLFKDVMITPFVFKELTSNKVYKKEAKMIENTPYIKVENVWDDKAVSQVMIDYGLDIGESESIVLALERNADRILMDEKKGRSISHNYRIKTVGTIGILEYSYEVNILTKKDILNYIDILKTSKRYISEALYAGLLNKIKNT